LPRDAVDGSAQKIGFRTRKPTYPFVFTENLRHPATQLSGFQGQDMMLSIEKTANLQFAQLRDALVEDTTSDCTGTARPLQSAFAGRQA